ncbi:MAG: tRNA (adenosine(37)-N6)-threonylcarbamoyltransferase complex dimerization subunit type 1 TsaB [Clostridia bacterium]|nr:tRNA (adenosine(37)-N6)-threonylcarbamoyltransferase complex dimerization subunit type 1 TsaB [Clostridia bacterium]
MLVLASDTTGKSLSIALVKDGRLVGESRFNLGYNHAVTHLPQVLALLDSCETSLAEVDLLAVTQGPGSFTGTRIGLSSFKAMAYAAHKPLVGVSTLETLAYPWRQVTHARVCPLLDARNGRVYAACYRTSGLLALAEGLPQSPLVTPGNYQVAEFLLLLAQQPEQDTLHQMPILLTGDGASVALAAQKSLPALQNLDLVRLDPIHDAPSAAACALLAEAYHAAGADGNPFHLNATYLTPSSAERLRKEKTQP